MEIEKIHPTQYQNDQWPSPNWYGEISMCQNAFLQLEVHLPRSAFLFKKIEEEVMLSQIKKLCKYRVEFTNQFLVSEENNLR